MVSWTVVGGVLDARRHVVDEPVEALDLPGCQRADAGRVAGDGIQALGERFHLLLDLAERPLEPSRHVPPVHDHDDLNGRHRERG